MILRWIQRFLVSRKKNYEICSIESYEEGFIISDARVDHKELPAYLRPITTETTLMPHSSNNSAPLQGDKERPLDQLIANLTRHFTSG